MDGGSTWCVEILPARNRFYPSQCNLAWVIDMFLFQIDSLFYGATQHFVVHNRVYGWSKSKVGIWQPLLRYPAMWGWSTSLLPRHIPLACVSVCVFVFILVGGPCSNLLELFHASKKTSISSHPPTEFQDHIFTLYRYPMNIQNMLIYIYYSKDGRYRDFPSGHETWPSGKCPRENSMIYPDSRV